MAQEDPRRTWVRTLGLFGVIVGDMVASTGIGVGLGYLAHTKLGAPIWIMIVTTMGGFGLAIYRLYQNSKRDFFGQD